jgi:Tol biopolymer transport system component
MLLLVSCAGACGLPGGGLDAVIPGEAQALDGPRQSRGVLPAPRVIDLDPSMTLAPGAVTADGRFVAFATARPLVDVDTNNASDVYLLDRQSGVASLVSVAADGSGAGNAPSAGPVIAADGSAVVFLSRATNLVAGFSDTNNGDDVFVRRLVGTPRTDLVSRNAAGGATPAGVQADVAISADGSTVAFTSTATSLVSGITDTNVGADVFVRRLDASVTIIASSNVDGSRAGNAASRRPRL